MPQKVWTYLWLTVTLALTLVIMLKVQDEAVLWTIVGRASRGFLLGGALCMVIFWLLDALIICLISWRWNIRVSLAQALRFSLVGQYYSLITPMASGAQPAQIYSMVVKGPFTVVQASSLLAGKFVIYQASVGLYSLIVMLAGILYWKQSLGVNAVWVALGLGLNLAVLSLIFLLAYNRFIFERVLTGSVILINKLGLGQKLQKESLIQGAEAFLAYVRRIKEDGRLLFQIVPATVLQLSVYFSVAYFACRALGVHSIHYGQIVALQSLLYMAYHFIPTPGNAGVAEGGFFIFFKLVLPPDRILPVLLLWRFLIYYVNLLVGGLVTLYEYLAVKRSHKAKMITRS
jgi:hypothetical protein